MNVVEFTEECLTVYWIYVNVSLWVFFGYLAPGRRKQDCVDLIYKRIHFQSDIKQESWQYVR